MKEGAGFVVRSVGDARLILARVGLPVVILAVYVAKVSTIGVTDDREFDHAVQLCLEASSNGQALIIPAQKADGAAS